MPRIAFIGVRISWLVLARKSDLALVAASAISLAVNEFRLQPLAFRNIFLQRSHVLWFALRVSEQKKSHACNNDAAVSTN
jgi:hypothetical protein